MDIFISVDYDTTAVDEMLDIHKYLMGKNDIKMFPFIKNVFVCSNDIFSL